MYSFQPSRHPGADAGSGSEIRTVTSLNESKRSPSNKQEASEDDTEDFLDDDDSPDEMLPHPLSQPIQEEDEFLRSICHLSEEEFRLRRSERISRLSEHYKQIFFRMRNNVCNKYRKFLTRKQLLGSKPQRREELKKMERKPAEMLPPRTELDEPPLPPGQKPEPVKPDSKLAEPRPDTKQPDVKLEAKLPAPPRLPPAPPPVPRRCSFKSSLTAEQCDAKPIVLSKFCFQHILSDPKQVLYQTCSYTCDGLPCPVPAMVGVPLPLCPNHLQDIPRSSQDKRPLPVRKDKPRIPEPPSLASRKRKLKDFPLPRPGMPGLGERERSGASEQGFPNVNVNLQGALPPNRSRPRSPSGWPEPGVMSRPGGHMLGSGAHMQQQAIYPANVASRAAYGGQLPQPMGAGYNPADRNVHALPRGRERYVYGSDVGSDDSMLTPRDDGAPIGREGPGMTPRDRDVTMEGAAYGRDVTPGPMGRDTQPMGRDVTGPMMGRDVPPQLGREVAGMSRDPSSMSRDPASMSRDPASMSRDPGSMSRDLPPMARDLSVLGREVPPMASRDLPPMVPRDRLRTDKIPAVTSLYNPNPGRDATSTMWPGGAMDPTGAGQNNPPGSSNAYRDRGDPSAMGPKPGSGPFDQPGSYRTGPTGPDHPGPSLGSHPGPASAGPPFRGDRAEGQQPPGVYRPLGVGTEGPKASPSRYDPPAPGPGPGPAPGGANPGPTFRQDMAKGTGPGGANPGPPFRPDMAKGPGPAPGPGPGPAPGGANPGQPFRPDMAKGPGPAPGPGPGQAPGGANPGQPFRPDMAKGPGPAPGPGPGQAPGGANPGQPFRPDMAKGPGPAPGPGPGQAPGGANPGQPFRPDMAKGPWYEGGGPGPYRSSAQFSFPPPPYLPGDPRLQRR